MLNTWQIQTISVVVLLLTICRSGSAQDTASQQKLPPAPAAADDDAANSDQSFPYGRTFTDPPDVPQPLGPTWNRPGEPAVVSRSYTLESLLELACRCNPTLIEARLHVNSQMGRAIQAGLYPNPVVSYVGSQIGLAVPGNPNSPGEWQGGEIQQRIVTANKLKLSRNKYLQRAKVAEFLAVAQQYRVCNDVRIHFIKSLAATEIIKLREELLKNARDNSVTTREMYNLGQATAAEVHQVNARLQQHRLALLNAQNNRQQHLLELMSLVGVELADLQLTGELESDRNLIEFDQAREQLLAQSPEVLAAHAKLREDHITVHREKVQWVPDIVVSGGSGYNFDTRENTAAAKVSVEVPLFDRNQGTVRQAEADFVRQRNEIRRTELHLQKMLAQTYSKYLTALQGVQNYRDVILPEKRKAYLIRLKSYERNRIGWPAVLTAYDDYTNSRIDYVTSQADVRINEVLIDGFLLHGGLNAPGGALPHGHIDSVPKPR